MLHRVVRYSHIACGFFGLILFWVPIFAVKGSPLHIRCGRIFSFTAYYVGTTGLISSLWCLLHPGSFMGPEWRTLAEREVPYVVEKLRFMFSILGFLSLGVLSGVVYGVRVIRTRRDHSQLGSPMLYGTLAAFGAWSVGLLIFGAWSLVEIYGGWHLLPVEQSGRYWIPTVLGLLGALGAKSDLSYIRRPPPTPMGWWYVHMENMLGVGIGFHTAFLVFGVSRFLPMQLQGPWQLVPWLLPTVIGLPVTQVWIRYYKRKFGELEPNAADAAHAAERSAADGAATGSAREVTPI
jgi:hypothetical protein